ILSESVGSMVATAVPAEDVTAAFSFRAVVAVAVTFGPTIHSCRTVEAVVVKVNLAVTEPRKVAWLVAALVQLELVPLGLAAPTASFQSGKPVVRLEPVKPVKSTNCGRVAIGVTVRVACGMASLEVSPSPAT